MKAQSAGIVFNGIHVRHRTARYNFRAMLSIDRNPHTLYIGIKRPSKPE